MSEQAMPAQIWADPPETFDDMDMWRSEPGGKGVRYILATPTALAADPAVKALVAEAVAAERERCAMAVCQEFAHRRGLMSAAVARDKAIAAIRKGETP